MGRKKGKTRPDFVIKEGWGGGRLTRIEGEVRTAAEVASLIQRLRRGRTLDRRATLTRGRRKYGL